MVYDFCNKPDCKICNLQEQMEEDWRKQLKEEFSRPYFTRIIKTLHTNDTIYPELPNIFNFSKFVKIDDVKVLILGQDPYHGKGQAMGLSFSVPKNIPIPPSLRNIYKEIKNSYPKYQIPSHGDLTNWAQQGVLLLNATLTVVANKPASHATIGWHTFTDRIIEILNKKHDSIVFMFWGQHAIKKQIFIDKKRHLVLTASHPSPFSCSRGFNGCGHFLKANKYLISNGKDPIKW